MTPCRNTMWPTPPRPPTNSACSHTEPCTRTLLRFQLPLFVSLVPKKHQDKENSGIQMNQPIFIPSVHAAFRKEGGVKILKIWASFFLGGLSMHGEVTLNPFMTQIAQIQVAVRL